MTVKDVAVQFHLNPGGLPRAERDEWARIVAAALAGEEGTATAVFQWRDHAWSLSDLRLQPAHWFLEPAGPQATAPLRARAVAALKAAGKNVLD